MKPNLFSYLNTDTDVCEDFCCLVFRDLKADFVAHIIHGRTLKNVTKGKHVYTQVFIIRINNFIYAIVILFGTMSLSAVTTYSGPQFSI